MTTSWSDAIAELESKQGERNERLCAPAPMPDPERFAMLSAMQSDAEKIEELTMRWEEAQAELDQAERELAAM